MSKFKKSKLLQAGILTGMLLLAAAAHADTFDDRANTVTVLSCGQFFVGNRLADEKPYIGVHPDSSLVEVPLENDRKGRIYLDPRGQVYALETGSGQGGNKDDATEEYKVPADAPDFAVELGALEAIVETEHPTDRTIEEAIYYKGHPEKISSGIKNARKAIVDKAKDFWKTWAEKLIPVKQIGSR